MQSTDTTASGGTDKAGGSHGSLVMTLMMLVDTRTQHTLNLTAQPWILHVGSVIGLGDGLGYLDAAGRFEHTSARAFTLAFVSVPSHSPSSWPSCRAAWSRW